MRKFDELGLTLCKLQANVFAQSKTNEKEGENNEK